MENHLNRSSMSTYNDKFNVMLIGDDGVGKTSLLERYGNGTFKSDLRTSRTVEYYNKEFKYEGKLFLFKLWDTVSLEKFMKISRAFYQKADCIIIVSSIGNRESFLNISKWVKNISDNIAINSIPIVLMINKVDLEYERQVGLDEIRQKAEELNVEYFETSAMTGYGIQESFQEIFKKVVLGIYKDNDNINQLEREEMETDKDKEEGSAQSLVGCNIY